VLSALCLSWWLAASYARAAVPGRTGAGQPSVAVQGATPDGWNPALAAVVNNGPPVATTPAASGAASPYGPVTPPTVPGGNDYAGYPRGYAPQWTQGYSSYPSNAVPTSGAPLPSPFVPPDPVAQAVQNLAPLTAKQVVEIRNQLTARDRAAYVQPGEAARGETRLIHIDLSPGAPLPTIHIAPDLGGTLAFIDLQGNPWPIEHVDNFAQKGYSVSQMSENVLSVWNTAGYVTGNMAVVLKGLPLPVTVTVEPPTVKDNVADYRSDLMIPRVVPDRRDAFLGRGARDAIAGYNDELTQFLLMTPPSGAKPLRVSGAPNTLAWQMDNGTLIVRTAASLRSPAWTRSTSAADGTHVYELQLTPLITIAGADGRLSWVQISGYDTVGRRSPLVPVAGER